MGQKAIHKKKSVGKHNSWGKQKATRKKNPGELKSVGQKAIHKKNPWGSIIRGESKKQSANKKST